MMRMMDNLWLWLFASIGALACAPEGEPDPAEAAADVPPEAGDNGPPLEAELGEAGFDDDEARLEAATIAEREGRDPDDEPVEGTEDEPAEEDEPESAAPADRRPAPSAAVPADDDPDAELERELQELQGYAGQSEQPTSPPPAQAPTGQPLPPPPPGYTWAMTAQGIMAIPLAPVVPQRAAGYQDDPNYDPDAPVTAAELRQREAALRHDLAQQHQRQLQQATLQAQGQAIVEGHLDRFSLTRDKNSAMRRAVRNQILEELPPTWTDEDFKRVAGRVTQQFYTEANRRKGKAKPSAAPAGATQKPKTQQQAEPPAAPKGAPRSRADEIAQERNEIAKFLKKTPVRLKGRR